MTASDEVRRLLDERGVEHLDSFPYEPLLKETEWRDARGRRHVYHESLLSGNSWTKLYSYRLTPAEAVEATLGRTPRAVVTRPSGGTDRATRYCTCGACGRAIDPWDAFCRWCGTEVAR